MSASVIILYGTSTAGKSTISNKIAQQDTDWQWEMVAFDDAVAQIKEEDSVWIDKKFREGKKIEVDKRVLDIMTKNTNKSIS